MPLLLIIKCPYGDFPNVPTKKSKEKKCLSTHVGTFGPYKVSKTRCRHTHHLSYGTSVIHLRHLAVRVHFKVNWLQMRCAEQTQGELVTLEPEKVSTPGAYSVGLISRALTGWTDSERCSTSLSLPRILSTKCRLVSMGDATGFRSSVDVLESFRVYINSVD